MIVYAQKWIVFAILAHTFAFLLAVIVTRFALLAHAGMIAMFVATIIMATVTTIIVIMATNITTELLIAHLAKAETTNLDSMIR